MESTSTMVCCGRPPRPQSTEQVTGEGQQLSTNNLGIYDAAGRNPLGHLAVNVAHGERSGLSQEKTRRIATWNVGGMSLGKLHIVQSEMTRLNIGLLGVSDLHWTDSGNITSEDFTVYYSGHDSIRKNGVAFIADKVTACAVESYTAVNDRIISIRIQGKPMNITVVQVYAPTTAADENEIEDFYAKMHETMKQVPQKDMIYVLGGFNAKVGNQQEQDICGRFGLGERNEAGDRLIQFCQENQLTITNTLFEQPKRRLYTWTSPDGIHRDQIDFILCRQRRRSSVIAVKTFPGADCGSDHKLLVATVEVRLHNIKKNAPRPRGARTVGLQMSIWQGLMGIKSMAID